MNKEGGAPVTCLAAGVQYKQVYALAADYNAALNCCFAVEMLMRQMNTSRPCKT